LYLVHVKALDADQLGRRPAAGRMQIALVIEPGHARRELVRANRARLARLLPAGRRDKLVVGHLGFASRLAVDGPRRAMIVRRRVLRAVVGVREDAEAELGVLVKDVAVRRLVVQTCLDEAFIQQGSLATRGELGPPGRPRTERRTYPVEASSNWTSSCPPSNTRSGGEERHAECIAKWIRSS